MTFTRIAVGLDGSPHSETALGHAFRIARAAAGTVRGVHVVDRSLLDGVVVADLSGSVGFQPFLNLSGELREALVSAGGAIVASFEARAKEAGVPFELVVKKGAGHGWLTLGNDLVQLVDWFDQHLKEPSRSKGTRDSSSTPPGPAPQK